MSPLLKESDKCQEIIEQIKIKSECRLGAAPSVRAREDTLRDSAKAGGTAGGAASPASGKLKTDDMFQFPYSLGNRTEIIKTEIRAAKIIYDCDPKILANPFDKLLLLIALRDFLNSPYSSQTDVELAKKASETVQSIHAKFIEESRTIGIGEFSIDGTQILLCGIANLVYQPEKMTQIGCILNLGAINVFYYGKELLFESPGDENIFNVFGNDNPDTNWPLSDLVALVESLSFN